MSLETTVTKFSSNIIDFLGFVIPVLSVLSVTVNCFHVGVLTRKSVTASSMNTLLIGIAIVDILAPIVYIKKGIWSVLGIWKDFCDVPGYYGTLTTLILRAINDDFRRCSTWFGLGLAVIRTVSVKMVARKRFDCINDSRFGGKVIGVLVFLSSLITISYLFRYQIIQDDEHVCVTSSGLVISTSAFSIEELKNKMEVGGPARRIHILLTGIFGQLIPSFLFPIFATILILELRKPEKKASRSIRTEKISKMVIYMTVTFLLIEFPIGIGKIVNSMQTESTIPHNWNLFFNYFYVPMTMFHCFICFRMSSQYRKTAMRMLGVEEKPMKVSLGNQSTYVTSVNK